MVGFGWLRKGVYSKVKVLHKFTDAVDVKHILEIGRLCCIGEINAEFSGFRYGCLFLN